MALKTHGTMAVDWEQRIDFDRLRRERLARVKEGLAKSEMGALLCFDMNNVRYITSTTIGSPASSAVLPLAGRALPGRDFAAARGDVARDGTRRGCGPENPRRARDEG